MSEITINGQALIYQIGYQPFGPANRWTWGNGTPYARSFDLDGQITTFDLNGSTQQLSYDAVGNIIQKGASQYSYDKLNRLISEAGAENQSFTYDSNGNRKSKVSDSENVTYVNHRYSNRLLKVGAAVYQYDANGNIIHDGEHSYTYDAKNRLVALNENEAQYVHNGLGQRIAKIAQGVSIPGDANGDGIINPADIDAASGHILQLSQSTGNADCNLDGSVNVADLICINDVIAGRAPVPEAGQSTAATLFAYDLGGQLIGEYNAQGNPAQEIVYFGNMPIATVKQGNVYYIYTDHLNTPRLIADTTNRAVWSWESDAFGEAAANDDLDGDGERFEFNLRFPGQYYDAESGLHYNYFRDYNPNTGRYVQSDPIGLNGGMNTFSYVSNNPIAHFDVFGLKKSCTLVWNKIKDSWRQTNIKRPKLIRGEVDFVFRVKPDPEVSGELPSQKRGRPGMPIGLGHGFKGVYKDNREWGYEYWWEKWAEYGYYEEICVDECGKVTVESDLPGNRPLPIEDITGEWRFDPSSDIIGPRG